MRWALPLVVALAGAAPERALFLFEFRGTPAGTVELAWEREAGRFTYRSTHLFTRGADRSRVSRVAVSRVDGEGRLEGGAWPSALWLWRRPSPGCAPGREELTGRMGALCAEAVDARGALRGTMLGSPFVASFSGGRLETLELEGARFTAVPAGTQPAWPPDVFRGGVPVPEGDGALTLEPPMPAPRPELRFRWDEREARRLAREVHEAIPDKRPSAADLAGGADDESGSCLAHARRFVRLARERGRDAAVIHGLLVEPGQRRAYPHAWVRVLGRDGQALDLDPTSLDEVTRGTHLALAAEAHGTSPGTAWMQMLSGRYTVVRRP